MKHYPCEKCGTKYRPTRHHVLPKIFFKGRGKICHLCVYHHREVELRIKQTEEATSGVKGKRHQLPKIEYIEILKDFLYETEPIQSIKLANVVAFRGKFPVMLHTQC